MDLKIIRYSNYESESNVKNTYMTGLSFSLDQKIK